MKKKAQSSLEFLSIFAISFTIIIILGGIFFTYSSEAKTDLDKDQIDRVFLDIMNNVDQIYFLGVGNRVTQKLSFPNNINSISIVHKNESLGGGEYQEFDYLNVSIQNVGFTQDLIYFPSQTYIRFNCTSSCDVETSNVDGNWISYYSYENTNAGAKQIRIENKGDFVAIDFLS